MKFSVNVSKFIKAIDPAIKISTKGLKDLNIISIEATEQEAIITAFGGELGISSPVSDINVPDVKYNFFKEGSCSIVTNNLTESLKSFPEDSEIVLDATKKELKIYSLEDKTEIQVLPLSKDDVKLPCIADKFSKELEINREAFVKGGKNVSFAIGFEDKRPRYKYWRLLSEKGNVKFMAGTGGIFAIYEIEGSDTVGSDDKVEFLFSGSSKDVISEILSSSDCDKIVIKQAEANRTSSKNIPDQIVISFEGKDILLVGFDPEINWDKVDFKSVLSRDNKVVVKTSLPNWIHAVKGIRATYTKDVQKEHFPHIADVKIDTKNSIIYAEVNSRLKSSRKVAIDQVVKNDVDEISFRCPSQSLDDMVNKSLDKKANIEILVEAPNKPILINYPVKTLNDSEKEKITIFFAPSNTQ